MPNGTLDLMKLDGQPVTYQIMFEQNAGGTFVARVESDELVPFLHEEMGVDLTVAESAEKRLAKEDRVRLQNISLEENTLHAVMEYLEEDI
jgi:hypothetical protein